LPTWFDHLEKSFSNKEVHFGKFCPPVKTSCPPVESVHETPKVSSV